MAIGAKTGGRVAGSVNKTTRELRDIIRKIIERELEGVGDKINKLKDRDRVDFLLKLLPYVVPKMEAINEDGSTATKIYFSLTKVNNDPAQLPDDSEIVDGVEVEHGDEHENRTGDAHTD